MTALLAAIPAVLAILAEAAWISVLAGLVQEYVLRPPVLSIASIAGFAAVGTVGARLGAPRAGERWPFVGLALVAAGAIAGWLAAPSARASLLEADLGAALAAHPGGFVAGLAVLRGIAHGGEHLSSGTVSRMLFAGIPAIGFMAAAGGMIADPHRARFLADTAVATVVFAGAGLIALAFAGIAEVERSGAPTWRRNPAWLVLLALLVGAILAAAAGAALAGGDEIVLAVELLFGVALVPLVLAGILYGSGAGFRRILGFVAVAAALVWLLSFAGIGRNPSEVPPADGGGTGDAPTLLDQVAIAGTGVLLVIVAAVVVVVLVGAWMLRRDGDPGEAAGDERSASLPDEGAPGDAGRLRGRGRRPHRDPTTAAEAYLRLVDDLAPQPDLARRPAETPSEHARRLRDLGASPRGALRLELLAADYGLSAFGDRRITPPETRRAIGRWRRLREELPDAAAALAALATGHGRRPGPAGAGPDGDDADGGGMPPPAPWQSAVNREPPRPDGVRRHGSRAD